MGLGGVGLSAVMAAKISSCAQIIAFDRLESRITLAKKLGATHDLNTTDTPSLESAPKSLINGKNPTIAIDTTASPSLLTSALSSLAPLGTLVPVGASDGAVDYSLQYGVTRHMGNGTRILGCIEGDSVPREFIPELIGYWREGRLPLEEVVRFYDMEATDFKTALHDMHSGETVKPVLTF